MKSKSVIALSLTAALLSTSLSACTSEEIAKVMLEHSKYATDYDTSETESDTTDKATDKDTATDKAQTDTTNSQTKTQTKTSETAMSVRPSLVNLLSLDDEMTVTPSVLSYTVNDDLSNIDNISRIYLSDGEKEKIVENGFVVSDNAGKEFFEIYETNRYNQFPSFVTVDSMMHTYHLYFASLLKKTEKNYLKDSIEDLSNKMLTDSLSQYEKLKGSEWESAARRNVAFFTVGAKLLNDDTPVNADVYDMVNYELDKINLAEGTGDSQVMGTTEDYSQYKPRGYYEGDDALESYFKAVMWYGRMHFTQEEEDLNRSALLITKALSDDNEAYEIWSAVYAITSFFAGESDDLGVCEYVTAVNDSYGADFEIEDLIGNNDSYLTYSSLISNLRSPLINSTVIADGDDNTVKGFRFMGQRFTIDASIMQKLIYSDVQENSSAEKRMLPDVLDVAAALGSDMALEILDEAGETDYKNYSENMEALRESFKNADESIWTASLYSNWLNTLNPLLEEKGEGYPMFMQSSEWTKKNLETYAGSYTELKHDTVLYAKQVLAEMGGDWDDTIDDRGYVEPEPVVYKRFKNLSELTSSGLDSYGMISDEDKENLSRLSELAGQLVTISNKELTNETLTDDEYELIRNYGGNLEHFWYDAIKEDADSEYFYAAEFPAALVVDIATNPNGEVLEAATGNPSEIYVVVNVDGKLKIARGSVYSFYEFTQPLDDRLTDSQWRIMMGISADDNYEYNYNPEIDQPSWTDSYRYRNE